MGKRKCKRRIRGEQFPDKGGKSLRTSGNLQFFSAFLGILLCIVSGLCGVGIRSQAKERRAEVIENRYLQSSAREFVLPFDGFSGEGSLQKFLNGGKREGTSFRIFRGMAEEREWRAEEFTRGKAVFVLEAFDDGAGLPESPYSFDGGKTWTADSEYEVTENGIYEARARDALGNMTKVKIVVDKIDNEAPEVDFAMEPDPWYKGKAVVKVLATDVDAGLADRAYSFDGGKTWQFYGQIVVKEPGEIRVRVRDAVGNEREASYLAVRSQGEGAGDRENEGEAGMKPEGEDEEKREGKGEESIIDPLEEASAKRSVEDSSRHGGSEPSGKEEKAASDKEGKRDGTDSLPEEGAEQGMKEGEADDPYGQEEVYGWIHRNKLEEYLSHPDGLEAERMSLGIYLLEKLLLGKFFRATIGSLLLSITALAALLSLGSGILYLFYMRVRIYNFDGREKYIYLGSVLLRENPQHLYVRIPESMWEEAVTDEYRLCPAWLAVTFRCGQGLLVETVPDGRCASVQISGRMECSLRKTWT